MPRLTCSLLALLALLLTATDAAMACSCLRPPPPPTALNEASAVFAGKVTAVERADGDEWAHLVAHVEVERIWKGEIGKTVRVHTAPDGAACGVHFEPGREYLIYAYASDEGELHTNLCTRTTDMSRADADITALGEGWTPGERGASSAHLGAERRIYAAGTPILMELSYRGGLDEWDGAFEWSQEDGALHMTNDVFVEVLGGNGQPLPLRHVQHERADRRLEKPFSATLVVTHIADLSEPGSYTLRWGSRDVAEHEVHLKVIMAEAAEPGEGHAHQE